ncbi:M15 family metallopeptidase [Micromonospora zamorensis]|uniref:M15 family metallopeptidase n=1 Tax=Micromonospora zamorensis TaxID=709883 RepID=UPI0037AC0399
MEGSNELSNHASGRAIDLNAPAHPMGKPNTFSAPQRKAIRKILDFCEGVVRHGVDYYSGRKDDMHFEIDKGASEVARIARKIRGLSAPRPPSTPKPPAQPAKVVVDGKLGAATIRRWQQVMGTPVDGKISEVSSLVKAVQRLLRSKGHKITEDAGASELTGVGVVR